MYKWYSNLSFGLTRFELLISPAIQAQAPTGENPHCYTCDPYNTKYSFCYDVSNFFLCYQDAQFFRGIRPQMLAACLW